jgi:hypothetical protein
VRLVGSWNDPFGQIHDSLSSLSFVKVYQLDTGSDLVHPRIGFKASADAKATTSKDLVQTAVFKGSKWQEDISGRLVVQDHAFLFPDGDSGSDDSDDSGDPDDYNSDVDANDDNDDDIEVDDEE